MSRYLPVAQEDLPEERHLLLGLPRRPPRHRRKLRRQPDRHHPGQGQGHDRGRMTTPPLFEHSRKLVGAVDHPVEPVPSASSRLGGRCVVPAGPFRHPAPLIRGNPRRSQAENPPIVLSRFPGPALSLSLNLSMIRING